MKSIVPKLQRPRCIRIFKTREQAEFAQEILKKGGFFSIIREDGFGTLRLADLDMESRFRLYIEQVEIKKAAEFLAKEMRKVQKV